MRVAIVVTHLLGAGHLRRAINLAQAFSDAGHAATVISGGVPVSQFSTTVQVQQLPALKSDGTNFSRLLTADGTEVDSDYLTSRSKILCEITEQFKPTVVITELFPFGRRMLRKEFISLLDTLKNSSEPPLVIASVRDILAAPSSDKKAKKTHDLIDEYYAAVLVHSNSDVIELDRSWPVSSSLAPRLRYTGFVAQNTESNASVVNREELPENEILVSAGSGSVGRHVFEAAVQASALLKDQQWRVLVAGSDADEEIERLRALCELHGVSDQVTIEPARADFRELLRRCQCSVSLCGYNTVVDLLQSGTPGVFIPFDEGGETEQTVRAQSLGRLPSYSVVKASSLTPEQLAASVREVCGAGRFDPEDNGFDGATQSVHIVQSLLSDIGR